MKKILLILGLGLLIIPLGIKAVENYVFKIPDANFIITETGKMGIGQTDLNPLTQLSIATGQISGIEQSTSTTPTYSFLTDLDTGINSLTFNTISLNTAGIQRLYINSSGNVGIGTTEPTSALHVVNTGTAYPAVRIGAGTGGLHFNGSKDGSVLVQGTDGGRSQFEVLSPDGINRVVIQAVNGTTGSYLQGFGSDLNVASSTFKFDDNTGTKGISFASAATVAADVTIFRTGVGLLSISGNVGIGTTAPSYKLDVNGAINSNATSTFSALYITGQVSADSFVDRTPAFSGDAIAAIDNIKSISGQINHDTLPQIAKTVIIQKTLSKAAQCLETTETKNEAGETITGCNKMSEPIFTVQEIPGRSIGGMISVITEAIKQQNIIIDQLKTRIDKLEFNLK